MLRILRRNICHNTKLYRIIANSPKNAFKAFYNRQYANDNNNLKIEQDPFYTNPLRKLSCIGCGQFLQTIDEKKSGYIPFNVYEKYTNGRLKFYTKVKGEEVDCIPDGIKVDVNNFLNYRVKTKIILCKRCYRLQHYKISDTKCDVDVNRIENIIKCRTDLQEQIRLNQERKKNNKNEKKNLDNDHAKFGHLKEKHDEANQDPNFEQNLNSVKNEELLKSENTDSNEIVADRGEEKEATEKPKELSDCYSDISQGAKNSIDNTNKCSVESLTFIKKKLHKNLINTNQYSEKQEKYDEISENNFENIKNYQCEEKEVCINEQIDSQMGNKKSVFQNGDNSNILENNTSEVKYYEDSSYNIDKRFINVYEKKDILKKRNEIKRLDAEKMNISSAKYVEADRNNIMNNLIKKMKKKSLVLYIIDITNIENTILPELYIGCKNKDINIIWLVNKIDCLPKSTNLDIIKIWFRNMIRQIKNTHINDLIFISALKCYNYNILEERMKTYIDIDKGIDIYIVGCVNVGKSSFLNSFLKFINYKHIGDIYSKRKKGGVTVSNIPYTTLNYNVFKLKKDVNIIDTIGIPTKYQYSSILYKDIDLNSIIINKKIQPFTYKLKDDYSIILGSLCYINLIYGNFALLTFYISNKVTIHMCRSEKIENFLEKKKCSFLYPPHVYSDFDLLKPFVKHTVKVLGKDYESIDDIVISDLCWFSITGRGIKIFEIYAPKNIKIYRRPSMINDGIKHTQVDIFKYKSYRGRTPKILKKKKKIIEQLDRQNPERRQDMKNLTLQKEQSQLENLHNFDDTSKPNESSTVPQSILADKADMENIVHYL
ncbi:GTP-binding protein, putative [Plasmodium chabaudi chabaudi]|uniref:GTP-binding protein, putative n=1 Tax=Plasmodium chabaudi chabaudi TaxID=31271 RepID=A0A4V0KAH0_PLACU|nr:GTP-binding protein, putative [Plasmodium chabaudi chabaudi]VTZ70211.1 GTP-binding protein, putative [Plasmodium chabaudi chabaudi]|eukprot:XP_738644.2 GTP-binding protein, putative [Plasmodium chabaudi chabaudi]